MVLKARHIINSQYGYRLPTATGGLDYFKGFNPSGEAHVTVITPPEFQKRDKVTKKLIPVLSKYLSMKEINNIARRFKIQNSAMELKGIGSYKYQDRLVFYYLIQSKNLLRIRRAIAQLFYARGRTRAEFDAELFFPHITIGYVGGNIHYPTVLKDQRTKDSRFHISIQ